MESSFTSTPLDTLCARAGQPLNDGQPLVPPIVQSTTFTNAGLDDPAEHAYSRVSNPTVAALEQSLGALEQAPPAVCFATGLAAETALLLSLLRAGDHLVCGRAVYGGTTRLCRELLAGLGITTTFVDATRPETVREALRPETRLIFAETPANPTLELTDLEALARIAREAGVLLAVDNTFLTPLLQQPLDHGADICVYSTTKFIEGHSTAMGGALVARDDQLLERFRFIRKSTGGIQTPFNAWLTLQGLRTLPIRLERQCESAEIIADWLQTRPEIPRVHYPGRGSAQARAVAAVQHRGRHGAVVSFEIDPAVAATRPFLEQVRLCRLVEHVGSVETLLTHPASMTHGDVPDEQRAETGVSDHLLRLSVGLESPDSIIADLAGALDAARLDRTEVKTSCLTPA